MKMWKRILTLILVLFTSVSCFFACGDSDKYKNMTISIKNVRGLDDDNVFTLSSSDNTLLNTFSFDVEVSGVGSDVDRSVICSVDTSVVKVQTERYNPSNGITSYEFVALKGDTTLIRFSSSEGNKTYDLVVRIEVPVEIVGFKNKVLAVVRGEEYTCSIDDLSFYPETTTQTAVCYQISAIDNGDNEDVVTANEYLSSTGKILINSTLKWFYLDVYSDFISSDYQDRAVVNVVDKIDASKVALVEDREGNDEYSLLAYENGQYTLTLASNTDNKDFEKLTQTKLQFNYDDSPMGDVKYSGYFWNNGLLEISDKDKFSISLKQDVVDSDIVEVKQSGFSYEITRKKDGVMTLTFVIDYNGFEGTFKPIEIPVTIKVAMFPHEIRAYSSKDTMEKARGGELKDDVFNVGNVNNNDKLVLYTTSSSSTVSNYLLTPVYICVWGEDNVIYGQEVEITINNPNVSIVDGTGENPLETVTSGGVFYLKKVDSIEGELILTIKSTVYENITVDIEVEYTDEAISISDGNEISVDLDIASFSGDPSTYNQSEVKLIADGVIEFTGLPKLNGGKSQDYSVVEVVFESDEYADARYDSDSNDIVVALKNKIGSTLVKFIIKDVYTSNGKEFESSWRKFTINYPLNNPELLKAQIDGFEKADNPGFEYRFVGSDTETVAGKAELLVGRTYNLYYLIGANDESSQKYEDIRQFAQNKYSPQSSNSEVVSVNGNLIAVKAASSEPVKITYCFKPVVGTLDTIYICFEISTKSAIKNLTTTSPRISIYDYNTINEQIENPVTHKLYREEAGVEKFAIGLNPTSANVDYELTWSIVLSGNSSINTSKVNTVDGVAYTFTSNKSWQIKLVVDGLDATLKVLKIPDGGDFTFDLKVTAKQIYIQPAYSDKDSNLGTSEIVLSIPVTVKKASYINGISIGAFNNTVKFDTREMTKDGVVYTDNNVKMLDYKLLSEGDFDDVVIKDVKFYKPSSDIDIKIVDSQIRIEYKTMSLAKPSYTLYMVALGSRNNKTLVGDIDCSNVTTYYNVYAKINVSVANGQTIPFEIDSAEDLIAIGNTTNHPEALSSNYVLTNNIDLKDYASWQAIGGGREFTGTISGRYYIDENTYNDYEIYNLTISVGRSNLPSGVVECYYGLFGRIGKTAKLSYMTIKNFNISIAEDANTTLTDYIGVLAGYNAGTLENCVVDDGLMSDVLNGAFVEVGKVSVSLDTSACGISATAYVGGLVGFNASDSIIKSPKVRVNMSVVDRGAGASATVMVGGLVGTNMGKIYGGNTKVVEDRVVYSNNFVATSGIEGYDVVAVINPHRNKDYLSANSSYGGVAGSNMEDESSAEIFGLTARTFVFGVGNIGGLVGLNNAKVSNSLVIPNLVGSGNIGGLIGLSTSGSSSIIGTSGKNIVTSNKVQMINFNDNYSYMNTSIYVVGSANVGGLIGSYSGRYTLTASVGQDDKYGDNLDFSFAYSIANNSVRSYFGSSIIKEFSLSDSEGKYYGDIVIAGGVNNVNVSGFIGNASNIMLSTGYVNTTIVYEATEDNSNVNIGGVLGKATGIVSIFNFSALGEVYNVSQSVVAGNIGGFIGDATGINAITELKEGSRDEHYLLNILYRVSLDDDYNSRHSGLVGYDNAPSMDMGTNTRYYVDKITISADSGAVKYQFANLMYSYSLLQIKNVYFAQLGVQQSINPNGFFGKGETISVMGASDKKPNILNSGSALVCDRLDLANVIATNSFYLGYSIDKFHDGTTLKTLTTPFVVTSNNLMASTDGLSLFGLNGVTYSNPLSITVIGSGEPLNIKSYANNSWQAKYLVGTLEQSFNALYICGGSETGLSATSPETYLKYYNEDVDGGTVLPFAEEKTYSKDGEDYVNLIVDIPPTILSTAIKPEVDVENDILLSSKVEKVGGNSVLNYDTNTLIYYELSKNIEYTSIDGVDVKVIDFNGDGVYSNLDISYSKYVGSVLASKNIYKLSDAVKVSVLPPFLQTGLVAFKSSNSEIAYIEVIDDEAYIIVCGVGQVEFTAYSIYNEAGENGDVAKFSVNIVSKVDDFGIYADMTYSDDSELFTDSPSLTILKSEARSTQVYVNLKSELDYDNDYLKNYSNIDLTLENSNSYGVLLFLIRNNSIYFDDEFENNAIKINDKAFSKMKFDASYNKVGDKYAYYVDAKDSISFTGLEEVRDLQLLLVPYIKHTDNSITILYDLNFNGRVRNKGDLTGGIAKIISLNVVKGAESVSSTSSADFLPNNTFDTVVSVKTDNDRADLFLSVSKQNSDKYYHKVSIYSDIDKNVKCDEITTDTNYPDKEFEDLGVKLGIGVYYFDKVYLNVTSISFNSSTNEKKYFIQIGVCDRYLFDSDLISSFKLNFNIVNLEAEMSTSVTELKISGQSINNSIAKTFSSIDEYLENKEIYDLSEYYESSTLVAGYPGLLQIDLFPEYANVDYVDITSQVINGYYVSMEQMVAVFNSNNVFDGYYKIYNEKREILYGGSGIRVKNYSYLYNGDYKYSGTYYLRTIVPTTPQGIDSFTITYKCYFEGAVVHTGSVVINVARIPDIRLTVNGDKSGVVALGKSINILAETESDITWAVNNVFTSVTDGGANAPIELGDGYYKVNIKPIASFGSNYIDYIGKDIVITATVELDIKGRVYKVSDSVTIRLALFTIDAITVKNVSNGYFHGTYNQPYDLKLFIVATYDEEYDKAHGYFITNAISSLSNLLSYYSSRSFYIIDGNNLSALDVGQYSDLLVSRNGNYLTIKNNRKSLVSTLKASITFTYTKYSLNSGLGGGINYGINFYTSNEFCYSRDCTFGLDFIRLSNEENPEPIYTAEELKNMEEGGYYILLSDITLSDWTPLDVAISSLDGNGYVLTIESFDYATIDAPAEGENAKTDELTLGIFSTISSSSVVKNLVIEVASNEELSSDTLNTTTGDLLINAQYYAKVTFGLLAGTNEGIVTNVNVTNNANSYRNQRNRLLYESGAIGDYTALSETSSRKLSIVNIDNGSQTSTASENKIAGLVAINSGYITNSSITNISVYGLDCVAGFVAENKNVISSSFFSGGNVHANVSADKSKTLGASGFVFENSGKIMYSYSAGLTGTHSNLMGINIDGFAGKTYSDNADNNSTPRLPMRNMDTGVVSESGNTSSFVYNNGGKINDCYSNFLVYGSETSGFVYSNVGSINNVYTLSSVIAKSTIHNPFISMVSGGEAGSVQANNSGSITNAFFLSVIGEELTDEEGSLNGMVADEYIYSSSQIAQPISATKLSNYSTFDSFAFNANMDSLSSIENISAIEEIVRGVWFYPSTVTDGSIYFKSNSYQAGAPQLVSANLNNYSLKYYVTDNESRMIENVYSGLLESTVSTFLGNLSRGDVLIETDLRSASNIASVEFPESQNKLDALASVLQSYGYSISSTDLDKQNLQYIKVKLYFEEDTYNALTAEADGYTASDEIKSIAKDRVLALNLYSMCFIKVELINKEINPLPSIETTYEYVAVVDMTSSDNSQSVTIEYGNSVLNPYLIKNANDYNVYVMRIDENFESNIVYNNYQSSVYLRVVKDFAFEGNDSYAKTYNVIYSGVLDGNGMTISSLRVNADTTLVNTLQNASNYSEIENVNGKKATSAGMFAKLVNCGTVKNLNVDVVAVNATGVNFVGTIAGQVIDARLYNIDVYSSSNAIVLGQNIVGGIAGRVTEQSCLVNLTSSISVSAYYYLYDNKISSKNLELGNTVASRYAVYNSPSITTEVNGTTTYNSSNFSEISYAGGIAGIVDLGEQIDASAGEVDLGAISRARSVQVSGSPTILGEVVGGLYGSLGEDTMISSSALVAGAEANLTASRVAGGLIGINYGTIARSYIENVDQDSIDASIKNIASSVTGIYGDNFENGNQTFFRGNPHYMGGLVGINIGGSIINSYGKVDVSNIDASYAGGLIGATIGGTINTVYTTANVYAFYGIGGLIGLNSGNDVTAVFEVDESGSEKLKNSYQTNIEFYDNHLLSHVTNPRTFETTESIPTINMQAIVAVNMWKLASLNQRRYHINQTANIDASIGSVIGYSSTTLASTNSSNQNIINTENIVTDFSGRFLNETMYTIASYTYDSIDGGSNLVLIEEVGNYVATSCEQASSVSNTDSIRHYNQKVYSKNMLTSGVAIKYEIKSSTDGSSYVVIADNGAVHYSRLRNLSSVRTLSEIIGRTYNHDIAIEMLSRLKREEGDTQNVADVEKLGYDTVEAISLKVGDTTYQSISKFSGNAGKQIIYDLNNWDSQIWSGTQVDYQDKLIDSSYILPVLTNNVADKIIEIRSYEDLVKYTKLYPNGIFYLMNDITVQGEAKPLCSRGNPFTGTLISNPAMSSADRLAHPNGYKITINNNIVGDGVTALFSAIKGATFKNFEVLVNAELSVSNASSDSSIGVLFGYAYSKGNKANIIDSISITFGSHGKIVASTGAKYVGVLGGYGDALYFKGDRDKPSITVNNPKVEVGSDASIGLDNIYVGGLVGSASIHSLNGSGYINIVNPEITTNLKFKNGGYEELAIGSVFGKVINTSISAGTYSLSDIVVSDPEMTITLNAESGDFVHFDNIGIGGVFGLVSGQNASNLFTISNVTVSTENSYVFSVTNNGVYAYSPIYSSKGNLSIGGIIGAIGTDGKGGVDLSNITLTSTDKYFTYTHNNNATNKLTDSINTSNVNVGASIGAVITCSGNIQSLNCGLTTRWTVIERDKVNINIGNSIGRLNSGNIKNVVSTTNIETVVGTSDTISPVTLGANTNLNVGGLIGQLSGGCISSSGYNANIVIYTSSSSSNNVNIGGLIGLASVDSDDYSISSCYAYGEIRFNSITKSDIDNTLLYTANIGGMVGKVIDSLKINYAVTANDIVVRDGSLDANTFTSSSSAGVYNAIGGFVGLLDIVNQDRYNFDLAYVYSISNIITGKSTNLNSSISGLVGKAIINEDYDISGQIEVTQAYYLANFMIDNNNIGTSCSVEDLLINNTGIFSGDSHWTVEQYKYPRLNVAGADCSRLTPEVINVTEISSSTLNEVGATSSAVIIKADAGVVAEEGELPVINVVGSIALNNIKDIYFIGCKLNISDGVKIVDTVASNQRVYGINVNTVASPIIGENFGKVAETSISALSSTTGYMLTNRGFDIHPTIGISSGAVLYGSQQGWTLYGELTTASSSLEGAGSNGEYQLTIVTYSDTKPLVSSKFVDSYLTNGTVYTYYGHSGIENLKVNSEDTAKNISNFADDYDFYNDWIVFSIPEGASDDYIAKRKGGRVFLRWELSKEVGGHWYYDGIDMYSNTQTAYKDYSWNNYVNYLKTLESTSWSALGITTTVEGMNISSAVGLAYASSLINNGNKYDYKITLGADIDLSGRLFTPIGGAIILGKSSSNVFSGSFDGGMHVISGMDIIANGYAGLFGASKGVVYKDVTISNSHILSTGHVIGGLVASQQAGGTISNVSVSNTIAISLMNAYSGTNIVGGVVGQIYNASPRVNTLSFEIENSGLVGQSAVYNGNYVGGLIGDVVGCNINIVSCSNEYIVKGLDRVGGLVGSIGENSTLTINKSHNLGDVIATNVSGVAGGLVGYDKADSTTIQISYNSSYVGGYFASGMIGYLCGGNARFDYTYVSRGDVGATLNGVTNTRNDSDPSITNNMNDNAISGNELGAECAFAYVSDSTTAVTISQSYSSIYGDGGAELGFTNSVNVTYNNSYIISSTNDSSVDPKRITHASLSQANNEIFDNWKDIWSRVSQRNNNYPVFMDSAWIGSDEGIEKNEQETYYIITTEEQLAWVATQVNTGSNNFEGATIQVGKDSALMLDFSRKLWSPIGYSETRNFKGTMDFRNVTIKNLTTNGYYKDGVFNDDNLIKNNVGLFGYTNGATIKGSVNFITDDTTINEGSHITTKGNYAGVLIGCAKNTIIDGLSVTNHLNIQAAGGNVGGIIGGYEINGDFAGTEVTIGNFVNYGSVSGKYEDSQNIGGLIGKISAPDDKVVKVTATSMYNYGVIGAGSGSSSGLVALIEGEKLTLEVGTASSSASIENSGTSLGGLFGECKGSLIVDNAIISNDTESGISLMSEGDEGKIILSSNNSSAHIGAIVGYGNNVTIKNVQYDNDGIKICNKNVLNVITYNNMSGAIGGLIGFAKNLTLNVTSEFKVERVEFEYTGETNENNYIGGIAGMIEEKLTINTSGRSARIMIDNISGIRGIGYMGGIAGYVGKIGMSDVQTTINNTPIEEITDITSEHYLDYVNRSEELMYNTFGNIGGAFGYIADGDPSNTNIEKISVKTTDKTNCLISSKTFYAGGVIGRVGSSAKLRELTSELSVVGDFAYRTKNVGGIVGYINSTHVWSEISNCSTSANTITGYEHVGGIIGQARNISIFSVSVMNTAIGVCDDTSTSGSWFVGGIAGEVNVSSISFATFSGTLAGSNYIGGTVGVAKNCSIYTAVAYITDLVVKYSTANVNISHPDEEVYAVGGIAGYIYAYGTESTVTNVDVQLTFLPENVNTSQINLGGAVGYGDNTDIKEASVTFNTLNVPNVYGIANKLYGSSYSVNWYCNHYWFVGDTDSQASIYMAYVYDLKSTESATLNERYNETVIYKLVNTEANTENNTTTFKFANGNAISENVESYERVKQIYFEAGLWNIYVASFGGDNSPSTDIVLISLTDSLNDRSLDEISSGTEYSIVNEYEKYNKLTYREFYIGLTKRYMPSSSPKDLILKLAGSPYSYTEVDGTVNKYYDGILTETNTYTKVHNGDRIINPLGSKFFPVRNISIIGTGDTRFEEGDEGYEEHKSSTLKIGSSIYGAGSSTDTTYNLYGLIGYTSGTKTIENTKFYGTIDSIENPVRFTNNADMIIGGVIATTFVANSNTTYSTAMTNVLSGINIDVGDAAPYVYGGLIGTTYGSIVTLSGVGNCAETQQGKSIIAGGIIGYAYNSTIRVREYTFDENTRYGIKNESPVSAKYISGGLFGSVYDTTIIGLDDSGVETTETLPLLLWNTGDVNTSVTEGKTFVGGIVGAMISETKGFTLRNAYSGNIGYDISADNKITYNYTSTQPQYRGNVVGGFVGYGYAVDGEFMIEHGVNAVQLGSLTGEITKVSVGIGAVVASAVNYKNIINFGSVTLNADSVGSFYMEASWYKPSIEIPSFNGITVITEQSFVEMTEEAGRISLENIINLGDVTSLKSGASVGGLVGSIDANRYDLTFINCYNSSNVTGVGYSEVGGYIGTLDNASCTVIISTNDKYGEFLDVVGLYVNDDSEPTYITGEEVGGVIGHLYTARLMGHINTVLDIDQDANSNYAIQCSKNYDETITNYINSSIKFSPTNSIITSNIKNAYVGGIIGCVDFDGVLVFTYIETPIINVSLKSCVGGVVGSILFSDEFMVFHSVDINSVTLTNGEGSGVGGLLGYVYGGKIFGEKINVLGDIRSENLSKAFDQSVGGLIGVSLSAKEINFNTVKVKGKVYAESTRGVAVGGIIGSVEGGETRVHVYVANAELSETITGVDKSDSAITAADTKNISVGGIVGYSKYSSITANKLNMTTTSSVDAVGFASSAGAIVGKAIDSRIYSENNTSICGYVQAVFKTGVSYTDEAQLSSAGGLVGYALDCGMEFNDTTITWANITGYVAGGLIGMASGGTLTSLTVNNVSFVNTNIVGRLYVSAVVGMAVDGASDKLDDASVSMRLTPSVKLKGSSSRPANGQVLLQRNGDRFIATVNKRTINTNIIATGEYSVQYKETALAVDNIRTVSSSDVGEEPVEVQYTVTRTEKDFNRAKNGGLPSLLDSFTINSTNYNGAYDVYYGNRRKTAPIPSNIKITNANLFAWVPEYPLSYILNYYSKTEIHSTENITTKLKSSFNNNGNIYNVSSEYTGESATVVARNYAITATTDYLYSSVIDGYITSKKLNVNVDKTATNDDLAKNDMVYMISSNVPIYRVVKGRN